MRPLNCFGKNESIGIENTYFVKQGRIPAIRYDEKIMRETKGNISMHPDGHDGAGKALARPGLLAM
jgi:UDP-N-acetylglucosamine/UDP-N-acetylgalactosamine diphosphorylase